MYKLLLENSRLHANEDIGIINQEILDLNPAQLSKDFEDSGLKLMLQKITRHLTNLLKLRFPEHDNTVYGMYRFTPGDGNNIPHHVFSVSFDVVPRLYYKRVSKTAFNYCYSRNTITLHITPRLMPVEPLTFILASDVQGIPSHLLNGTGLLRRIWKQRFVEDQKVVWDQSKEVITKSINAAVIACHHDIQVYRYRTFDSLLPHEIYYISNNIIENLLHLMTLVSINNNIEEYKLLALERTQLMEFFQLSYDHFFNDPYALDFVQAAMAICGKWLRHMLEEDYNHLVTKLRKSK